jgi:catechol 2,3-dioxygenase-like lactoylglutathione lyase family enzyme
MDIQFIASIAVITPDPQKSRELFIDALGLPLEASAGSDYFHSERIEGSKHFGVWPLSEAAQACFGTPEWPADRAVPQMSLEFEVRDADAVETAAGELRQRGFTLLHDRREEPWAKRWLGFNHKKARSSGSRSRLGSMTRRAQRE